MSANLVVDLAQTCDYKVSLVAGSGSNLLIGQPVDLLGGNTYCNVFVAGGAGSGAIELRIQTSPDTSSGNFTDPTSGLPFFPAGVNVQSGGRVFANSGFPGSGYSSPQGPVGSAPLFCSGNIEFAAFQRPHRYARLVLNSGPFPNFITAGFVTNKKTTASGGGFTYLPGSGSVDV